MSEESKKIEPKFSSEVFKKTQEEKEALKKAKAEYKKTQKNVGKA